MIVKEHSLKLTDYPKIGLRWLSNRFARPLQYRPQNKGEFLDAIGSFIDRFCTLQDARPRILFEIGGKRIMIASQCWKNKRKSMRIIYNPKDFSDASDLLKVRMSLRFSSGDGRMDTVQMMGSEDIKHFGNTMDSLLEHYQIDYSDMVLHFYHTPRDFFSTPADSAQKHVIIRDIDGWGFYRNGESVFYRNSDRKREDLTEKELRRFRNEGEPFLEALGKEKHNQAGDGNSE